MFTLRQLEARFIKWGEEMSTWTRVKAEFMDKDWRTIPGATEQVTGMRDFFRTVETLAEADGISYLCPACFKANNGPVGTHGIHTYFAGRGVPTRLGKNKDGQTVRWVLMSGTGLDDLVLTPSIQLQGGCNWHGFIGSSGIPPGHAG